MTDTRADALPDAAPPPPEPVGGVRFRPAAATDAADIHALYAAGYDVDEPQERETLEDVEQLFATPWWDAAADGLVGHDDDGRLVAFGSVRKRPGQLRTRQALLFGDVHPDVRRRGVGRALLGWQVARGLALLAGETADVPHLLRVYAEDQMTDRRRLLASAGFEPRRFSATMRRDLAGPAAEPVPVADPPADVRVVGLPAVMDELQDAVRRAHNEAFSDHWGSEPIEPDDWRRSCVEGTGARPDLSFAAVDGSGEVVGYLVSGTYPQDWEGQGFSEGWTNLLGVRPSRRGQGLARALLARAMTAYAGAGLEQAGLAVDVDNPRALELYTGLGYVQHGRETSWVRDVAVAPGPEEPVSR